MDLKLFNTLGHKKQVFAPLKRGIVLLYTCGPTVYRSQHIGNYRTFVFEDILKRTLLVNGFRTQHVMNITDVGHPVNDADEGEDKIAKEARRQKKSAWDIAHHFEEEFKRDIKKLNILPPDKLVRATDHIKEQIALIKILEKKAYTYRTSDGVYFDTSRLKDYGKLAPKNIAGIKSGARVARGEKRNPTDFALWKFSPPAGLEHKREMEWASPWGVGFPGWHIECSAMSMKYLGETLDIHCGGADHIAIHHTNEIAQSEAATGKRLARFWMHAAFLTVKGTKMAKSSPETNIIIASLEEKGFEALDFRYFVLGTQYRKPLSFSWEALASARNAREKLLERYRALPRQDKTDGAYKKKFLGAVNDDLNTARALAAAWQGKSQAFLLWADHVLGLGFSARSKQSAIPPAVLALAKEREMLRKEKKWKDADNLREKIEKLGFEVRDTPTGAVIHPVRN